MKTHKQITNRKTLRTTYSSVDTPNHIGTKWRAAVCFLVLYGFLAPAAAGTQVGGTIVNQRWTKANSPYYVTNNINVAGKGLTIEPGVWVIFQDNWVFEVAGMNTAIGTISEPIVFTRTNGIAGWQGIYYNESGPSELAYCVISNSVNSGIRIRNSSPIIRDCTIMFNRGSYGGGINADILSGNLILKNCTVANNSVNFNGRDCWGGWYLRHNVR